MNHQFSTPAAIVSTGATSIIKQSKKKMNEQQPSLTAHILLRLLLTSRLKKENE